MTLLIPFLLLFFPSLESTHRRMLFACKYFPTTNQTQSAYIEQTKQAITQCLFFSLSKALLSLSPFRVHFPSYFDKINIYYSIRLSHPFLLMLSIFRQVFLFVVVVVVNDQQSPRAPSLPSEHYHCF